MSADRAAWSSMLPVSYLVLGMPRLPTIVGCAPVGMYDAVKCSGYPNIIRLSWSPFMREFVR